MRNSKNEKAWHILLCPKIIFKSDFREFYKMIASKDIKPITDLKRNTKAVLEELHRHKRPVILTLNGRPDTVLVDIETYESQVALANLSKFIQEGEQDIRKGNVRSAKKFLETFKNAKKV